MHSAPGELSMIMFRCIDHWLIKNFFLNIYLKEHMAKKEINSLISGDDSKKYDKYYVMITDSPDTEFWQGLERGVARGAA